MPPLPQRSDADWVALLIALDPVGLGGAVLRAAAGAARDAWLERLVGLAPADMPVRRVPLHVDDDRLLGGLDLAATLQAGRVVAERGLLAAADGGLLVLAMAERMDAGTAARIAAALDTGEHVAQRAGPPRRTRLRIGAIALDEGIGDDEAAPARLAERLAFRLELGPGTRPVPERGPGPAPGRGPGPGLGLGPAPGPNPKSSAGPAASNANDAPLPTRADVAVARASLAAVTAGDEVVEALCAAALALGADSLRAPLLAVRAARGIAALAGRPTANAADAALAARLVLAHRATRLPPEDASAAPPDAAEAQDANPGGPPAENPGTPPLRPPDANPAEPLSTGAPPEPPAGPSTGPTAEPESEPPGPPPAGPAADVPADRVLDAALAALPQHLLDALQGATRAPTRLAPVGRAGALLKGTARGRPIGVRRAVPRGGARLALLETLRAAAPWQALRRAEGGAGDGPKVRVRRDDFHVRRYALRSETTTVFVVDASGSSALHRLAEAKGAVELLLADCYVRRDSVALIAFRGRAAELLLPPTRSLARARRSLAGLPGGGATPLAAGIDAAAALVETLHRRGSAPFVVLLTDGRGNVARDGTTGRAAALHDALAAAAGLRRTGAATLFIDTSPTPQPTARSLAEALAARYLPLPHAGARDLSRAVREALPTR